MYHIPIMPSETAHYLVNNPQGFYVDATFGGGGHTAYLLDKYENIKMAAFDWDEDAALRFKALEAQFGGRVLFIRENFKNTARALKEIGIEKVDGILADIGVSSKQFDDEQRGFSFNAETLDMRMDLRNPLNAKNIVNSYGEQELADIFYKYGEERFSRRIAKVLVERRKKGKINSSRELADIIRSVKKFSGKTDAATKVFQSLRIFVNGELQNLAELLQQAPSLLNPSGRLVIIDFHSLEDRMIKSNIRENEKLGVYKNLTKKVVTALQKELNDNPRARSAKLRAAEKI